MNSILTLSGVCDNVVYKWLLLALYRENIRIKHIEENSNGIIVQATDQQDDMYEAYRRLKDQITQAEADLKLELTNY